MKKLSRILAVAMALAMALGLSACGGRPAEEGEDVVHVLATTYPVYLFTTAVAQGVDGVEVNLLVSQQTSCLHDYTLTVKDMKAIERADVILINGGGLEDFLADALDTSDAPVIDCSAGIELLPALGHEGHDHDTECDPHFWMTYENAACMLANIAQGLGELDPEHGGVYNQNSDNAADALRYDPDKLSALAGKPLITFHDGFQYFARAAGLNLLRPSRRRRGRRPPPPRSRRLWS